MNSAPSGHRPGQGEAPRRGAVTVDASLQEGIEAPAKAAHPFNSLLDVSPINKRLTPIVAPDFPKTATNGQSLGRVAHVILHATNWKRIAMVALCFLVFPSLAQQPPAGVLPFSININAGNQPQDVDTGIKILFVITVLTLAPSIILLMTCFTRIIIVFSFVRSALSLQGAPANQVLIGLALFMTFFIMAPVWEAVDLDALKPYNAKQISADEAFDRAAKPIRNFMLKQARPKDVELFASMGGIGPTSPNQLPMKVVIPGFIISELRTAFQMGFLIFIPFILIDLVVATVLMSLGMMMMPPMTISLPLKILLFVLVDGWSLIVRSLVQSFGI